MTELPEVPPATDDNVTALRHAIEYSEGAWVYPTPDSLRPCLAAVESVAALNRVQRQLKGEL